MYTRKFCALFYGLYGAALLLMVLALFQEFSAWAGWLIGIGLALAAVAMLAKLFLWRCPVCEKSLGRTVGPLQYCPHCGKPMD